MVQRIVLITPITQPSNLLAIYDSIASQRDDWNISWYLTYDRCLQAQMEPWKHRFSFNEKRHLSICFVPSDAVMLEHEQINLILDLLENQAESDPALRSCWVYPLKDDTILHPDLLSFLSMLGSSRFDGVAFDSECATGGTLSVNKEPYLHSGMAIYRLGLVQGQRTYLDHESPISDVDALAQALYQTNKQKFLVASHPLSYHKYLVS
jgi:hypothetical protein